MTVTGRRWALREIRPQDTARTPFPALIGQLLWNRGLRSLEEAVSFLSETPANEHDPMLLPDIEFAIARLRHAVTNGEKIAIFGDYDVDGVTAAALLTEALQELGAETILHIPDRIREGYGLSKTALEELTGKGAKLIVSADCGTSNIDEVFHARSLGLDVVILDHHSVPEKLPEAVATINPKRDDSSYPERELTAVGVAYKVMSALYEEMGRTLEQTQYLDLVALGTVADVAPLLGENRALVQKGLTTLAKSGRNGLRALMKTASVPSDRVDAEMISFLLAPRLNAAGRLAHARLAFDLLVAKDEYTGFSMANQLHALNRERQRRQAEALELAAELMSSEDKESPLIFVGHESISLGIVGIVAGRIADERYRPAFVYERGKNLSRASGRSIPEYDITSALHTCRDILLRFGGHHQAAGFTAETSQLERLKERLQEHAARELESVQLSPTIEIDAALPLSELQGEEIRWMARLQPFGEGNPEPTFLSQGVLVTDARRIGQDGSHLRLKLKDGPATWPAIAFRLGNMAPRPGESLDVIYSLAVDRSRENRLELRVKDFSRAASN